jgi:hypothetical protein
VRKAPASAGAFFMLGVLLYTRRIFIRTTPGGRVSKDKVAQSETNHHESSYAFEALEQFMARHLAEGHDVRMFLDKNGNSYSIFCIKCDPRMAELTETRH